MLITKLKPHPLNREIYGENEPLEDLLESIKGKGIMEPLVVNAGGFIISGHRRWKAALSLGLTEVPCRVENYLNLLDEQEAIIAFNRQREKTFTQKMMEAEKLKGIEAEKAKERQQEHGYTAPGKTKITCGNVATSDTGKTRDKVAEKIGMSGRTYDKASRVWEEVKKGNEIAIKALEKLDKGEATVNKAFNELKKEQRKQEIKEQKEAIETGAVKLPEGVYEVIVIDPPWQYGTPYDPNGRRGATPYPDMSQEELKTIKLPSAENSVLFLWTTHRFIWDAKELLDHWGFEYRATLVWDKEKIGIGDLFRMQVEFCLVGIKGKPVFDNDFTWRDIIREPRREHSRKPETFYEMVNSLCVGRKLDYFSRQVRQGWEVFGNETDRFADGAST